MRTGDPQEDRVQETWEELGATGESPALVVVVSQPSDLARAEREHWYRIPLARAPKRIAAELLAFYLTGSFPPEERWSVRWIAPVHGYTIATRQELIPEEPNHPRAAELYFKITLGALRPLPRPIRSLRLRRITFIPTTLRRLYEAEEINDLWIKSSAQEKLWAALKQSQLEAERQYPLQDALPQYVADFALFCRSGRIAVIVSDEPEEETGCREHLTPAQEYLLAGGGWTPVRVSCAEIEQEPMTWAGRLARLAADLGGLLIAGA